MRGKSVKWLSLIIPLILSLAITRTASAQSAIFYVDPPSVIDSNLQAPSTFTVSLKVSDVSNLAMWQCNMTYDPSMVSVTDVVFGDFLQGNPDETLDSYARYHDTDVAYSSLTNPYGAHDGYMGTYASLNYGEADGRFWLYDFPRDEYADSQILQVDLNVRYSATASGDGDQYRIVYYAFLGGEITLVDWTSAAASLATHTWTNPTNPFGVPWAWAYLTQMKIAVQTDSVGGDPSAVFNLYEAWFTVTYVRPTAVYENIDNVDGWAWLFQYTAGTYITGISGSGWLANLTFQVLDYGYSELNIDDPVTALVDPLYNDIPFTPENGVFDNRLGGDANGDRSVNWDDFIILAGCYGSSVGDGMYDERADFNHDGDVNWDDFIILAGNYGTSI